MSLYIQSGFDLDLKKTYASSIFAYCTAGALFDEERYASIVFISQNLKTDPLSRTQYIYANTENQKIEAYNSVKENPRMKLIWTIDYTELGKISKITKEPVDYNTEFSSPIVANAELKPLQTDHINSQKTETLEVKYNMLKLEEKVTSVLSIYVKDQGELDNSVIENIDNDNVYFNTDELNGYIVEITYSYINIIN